MGAQLLRALYSNRGDAYLSPATRRQLALSTQLGTSIAKKGLDALSEPINDLLNRDGGWITAARNALIGVSYPSSAVLDPISVAQRSAFDAARGGRYEVAQEKLRAVLPSDDDVAGWLLSQVAAMAHPLDASRSQQILTAAHQKNRGVTKPLSGVLYRAIETKGMDQARQAAAFLQRKYNGGGNVAILGMNGILGDLVFNPDGDDATANLFEQGLMDLGLHLGFKAQRPEREGSPGLDVLWGLGHLNYLMLPCKSNARSETISKQYTDQVSGNINWFRANYDATCTGIPAIVHPSRIVDGSASPPPEMRVIAREQLTALRECCRAFITAVKDRLDDEAHLRQSLSINNLLGPQIVERFTAKVKLAKT